MPKQPTFKQCEKLELIKEDEGSKTFAIVHPQWGGYVGWAEVTIDKEANGDSPEPGCFDVLNHHDGEFPNNPEFPERGGPTFFHYCSAEQVINFALTILELQCKHQKHEGENVFIEAGFAEDISERIHALVKNKE